MPSFFVVRPNLGQPLILVSTQLRSFEITIAGKDSEPPGANEILATLNALQLSWKKGDQSLSLPLKFRNWIKSPWQYNIDKPGFPNTALEHQRYAGFRWEARLRVGIDMPESWEPAGGFPIMANIRLSNRTNFHAVYVTENLPPRNNIKFFHLTDTHTATRNDVMPTTILQHLEPWRQKIFNARYRNYNNNLRAVIKYANQKAAAGELDFIVLTGDVVDYIHDGYFRGDSYHYGYGKNAPTSFSSTTSNIRNFVNIITGQDGLCEPLTVPLFVLPGNHDYIPYEPLGACNVDPELNVPGWVTFVRLLAAIPLLGVILEAFTPLGPLFRRLPGSDKFNETADRYPNFGLNKPEIILFDLWKKGEYDRYRVVADRYKQDGAYASVPERYEETISLQRGLKYVSPEPKSDYIEQFLTEINYDTDFTFSIHNHQFVCLNTGHDVHIPSVTEIIKAEGDPSKLSRKKMHYLTGYPHNRGFLPDHERMIEAAKRHAGNLGKVFIFSHAPFLHTAGDPELPGSFDEIEESGRPPIVTDDLSSATETLDLDYDTGEGLFPLITENFYFSYAGHTHGNAEFRVDIERLMGRNQYDVACRWGHYSEIFEIDPDWIQSHQPLFFTSGSLKSPHPMVREIHIGEHFSIKAKMNRHVPRLNQQKTAGSMTCFLTGAVSHFAAVAGYRGNLKHPIDGAYISELYAISQKNDRDLVMWHIIDNFIQMCHYLGAVISLGGFAPGLWGGYGYCDEQDLTVHEHNPDQGWSDVNIVGWDWLSDSLLDRRNLAVDDNLSDEEKVSEKYRLIKNIHDEIHLFLKKISGWVTEDGSIVTPDWYENRDNYEYHWPSWMCRILRLLLANIAVWLNRFGVQATADQLSCIDVQHQFNTIDPTSGSFLNTECQQLIFNIFQFVEQDKENLIRLWYTQESTFLAEYGGYKIAQRNDKIPSVHLDWAKRLPGEAVAADLISKYNLQAERQFQKSGIDGLKAFYAKSSARLAGWAATGEPILADDYFQQCANWNDQQILDDLRHRLDQVIERLL